MGIFYSRPYPKLSGGKHVLMLRGDPPRTVFDGVHIADFCMRTYKSPEVLNEQSQRKLNSILRTAAKRAQAGHLLNGFGV
ncbi:MAG: hypothetical protein DBX51_05985 [Clostridiales bacterium]|nr:MAG: hypothetical protein DBX51_05985 [Clostridiales bacterium]